MIGRRLRPSYWALHRTFLEEAFFVEASEGDGGAAGVLW